jgi:hypothetical protein
MPKRRLRCSIVAVAIAAGALSLAAKDFIKPVAHPAKTYPAHDAHPDEKVAIAADPYDNNEKAKIFTIHFREHDLLPIFFIVTNDGDQPLSIANMQVTLSTGHRAHLTPIATDDIYRRLSNPQAHDNQNIPFPFPRTKVKGTVTRKEMDEIESAQFAAKAVEPHGTQSGFLFFDVEDIDAPLNGSSLSVTGVDDATGKELMYFEIQMNKYLNATPTK